LHVDDFEWKEWIKWLWKLGKFKLILTVVEGNLYEGIEVERG